MKSTKGFHTLNHPPDIVVTALTHVDHINHKIGLRLVNKQGLRINIKMTPEEASDLAIHLSEAVIKLQNGLPE
jgi:hypothetical protein